jgi:hypothetical protein
MAIIGVLMCGAKSDLRTIGIAAMHRSLRLLVQRLGKPATLAASSPISVELE